MMNNNTISDWLREIEREIESVFHEEAEAEEECESCKIGETEKASAPNKNKDTQSIKTNEWRAIKKVSDLPEYSGEFIVTIEEHYYSINCMHSGPRKERSAITAWYDADSMIWEVDGVAKPIDAIEGETIGGVLTFVVAWHTLPEPYEGD